jgi:hypothetical protein
VPGLANCRIRCRTGPRWLQYLTRALRHAKLAPDTSKLHHYSHDMSQDSPHTSPRSSLTYKIKARALSPHPAIYTHIFSPAPIQPTYHQYQPSRSQTCPTPNQRPQTRPAPAAPHGPTPRRLPTSLCYARTRAKSKPRSPYVLPIHFTPYPTAHMVHLECAHPRRPLHRQLQEASLAPEGEAQGRR